MRSLNMGGIAATLAVLFLVVLSSSTAHADPVTFGTSGVINCSGCTGSGTPAATFGGLTLTFTGVPPGTTVNANPFTFTSFGEIQTTASPGGGTITPGTTFVLTISQTVPGVGSGNLSAILSGSIDQNSSSGQITFTVTGVNIAGVQYDIQNNPLALVPPSTNNGITSIQGRITTVPEPASMLLFGTSLAGLGGYLRREHKKRCIMKSLT